MSNISQTNRAPNKIAMEERKRGGGEERERDTNRTNFDNFPDNSQIFLRDVFATTQDKTSFLSYYSSLNTHRTGAFTAMFTTYSFHKQTARKLPREQREENRVIAKKREKIGETRGTTGRDRALVKRS